MQPNEHRRRQTQPQVWGGGAKKKAIRQKLPLGDLGDDDDDGIDVSAGGGGSIGDMMKQVGQSRDQDQESRARMFGVDMSRISKQMEDETWFCLSISLS